MAMTQIYLGERSNGCSYVVDGNVLTITPFNAITAAGKYALKIPAGLITRKATGEDVTMSGEIEFEVVAPEATEDEYVTVGPETVTPVIEKGAATYNYLEQDNVVLDWATYRGLQVNVIATLKINGMVRETLPLTLETEDPLKLTGNAEYTVDRELRKNLDVKVFEKLVLTSSAENYANLLTTDKKAVNKTASNVAADLDAAQAYAASVYGVDLKVVLGEKGVYYYDNSGNLIILGTNKYNYEASTGILTIYGDDAQVKNYYADFTAVMTSRICGGEHQVPFRVIATLKK
jgi:hypothetical protein